MPDATQMTIGNTIYDIRDTSKIPNTEKGAAGGVASLNSNVLVPPAQLAANGYPRQSLVRTSSGTAWADADLWHYDGMDLRVKFAGEMDNTDPAVWVQQRLANHDISGLQFKDYWECECSGGVIIKPQIAGINQYLRFNDQDITGWHIDWISRDLWPECHVWNKVNYNNGLSGNPYPILCSDLKLWMNSEKGDVPNGTSVNPATVAVDYTSSGLLDKLPTALKNVIVNKRVLLSQRYSNSGLLTDDTTSGWADLGKLWVPSEVEVYGFVAWGTKGWSHGAFTQYPIFFDSKMRIKGLGNGGGRCYWWLLAPFSGASTHAADVSAYGDASRNACSNTSICVPVCFRISE